MAISDDPRVWRSLYPGNSGMDQAAGFRALWSGIKSFSMWGMITVVVWLPCLLLTASLYDRVSRFFFNAKLKPNGC
jgi:hypothetical protein